MIGSFDAIIVGGGTMGSAAAASLADQGQKTLVLEQYGLVHPFGSHGGRTRIIRQAYAESPDYVPLVKRSELMWQRLEAEVGVQILHRTGGLDLQTGGRTWAADARQSATLHGIPHEWIDGAEVRHRWPAWNLGDEWRACFTPTTGLLDVEAALRSFWCVGARRGAQFHQNEPAHSWSADASGVEVRTDRGLYRAARLVLTAGGWAGSVVDSLGLPLTILRKVVWWFDVVTPREFAVGRFPIFISDGPHGIVYGFPINGVPGVKAGRHDGGEETTADSVDRGVRPGEARDVLDFARSALPKLTSRVLDRAVCLYSMTPDRDFIVDRHPLYPNVAFAAGFSGHGFKFAPIVGEMLADLALDPSASATPRFALSRFGAGEASEGTGGHTGPPLPG